jgi:thiol:disulfide interchange protein
MVAIGVVAFMYFASVLLLLVFPADPHVSALVSMYKDMIVAIAAIAGTLVGIQGLVDWKYNSGSSAQLSSESIRQEVSEKKTNNAKEQDYETNI